MSTKAEPTGSLRDLCELIDDEAQGAAGSPVVVRLPAPGSLSGIVRCEGAPVIGVPVRLVDPESGRELGSSRTRVGGDYLFSVVRSGRTEVRVDSPQHIVAEEVIDVLAGRSNKCDFDLRQGLVIRGRVVDGDFGYAIPNAQVAASRLFRKAVRSGPDGSFELGGIRARRFVQLHARARDYSSGTLVVPVEEREKRNTSGTVVVELSRGGSVMGRALDAGGVALAQVYVAVGATWMRAPGSESTDWIRARVDPQGRFVIPGLRPKKQYWISARSLGFGTRMYALPRKLRTLDNLKGSDVVMRREGRMEGRVVDERGEPGAGIKVTCRGRNSDALDWLTGQERPKSITQFEMRDMVTDSSGDFGFAGLSAGRYVLYVSSPYAGGVVRVEQQVEDGRVVSGLRLTVKTSAKK